MAIERVPAKAKKASGDFEKLPDGEYEGRLVYVADLGFQDRNTFNGPDDAVKDNAKQLSLGIEILEHTVQINGEDCPRVLWSRSFNIFYEMTGLGNEIKMYRVFNPAAQEGEVADWEAVLGTPVNVLVGKSKGGYDEIKSLTPIPTKYQGGVAEAAITPCEGDCNDPTNPCTMALFGLPKYLYDKRLPGPDPVEAAF